LGQRILRSARRYEEPHWWRIFPGTWSAYVQVDKTKLNAKSSTKAEVVGSSNSYLPNVIWAKMFLAEQGYELTDNDFYQDNQSAIRLEKNGRASCRQKSRHINIGYFFMKDRFVSENISVVYCPTEEMLANFF
jgi:hypothetical protein